jgi:NADH-quinone oxidoreductase subunit N
MNGLSLLPELYFFLVAAFFLALTIMPKLNSRQVHRAALYLTAAGVVISLAAIREQGTFFSQILRFDFFSQLFKILLTLGVFLVVCLCAELKGISENHHPEFYFLLTLSTLGMMLLVSSIELLSLYVSLELVSYSLYLLVPLRRGYGTHLEGGLKYFLQGAATSAIMLFGLALLYGSTGTTYLLQLKTDLPGRLTSPPVFIGLLFTLSGFFFKLALFPFHVWAPGVYQSAANQVTAFIATASKVAAMAILLRLISLVVGNLTFVHLLVILSIASMTLGNLAALVQKDLKRLLAYSTIAHAGYVLIGLLSMSEKGYAGVIFYALAYLMMNFLIFLVLIRVASQGEDLAMDDLAGLHRRSPFLAMALMLAVFSLGGLPPTIGFSGKFLLFLAAMERGHFYLVLIGMVNVVISLYYYALLIKAAYFLQPADALPPIPLSIPDKILTAAVILVIVTGGFYPTYFYGLAKTAASVLF